MSSRTKSATGTCRPRRRFSSRAAASESASGWQAQAFASSLAASASASMICARPGWPRSSASACSRVITSNSSSSPERRPGRECRREVTSAAQGGDGGRQNFNPSPKLERTSSRITVLGFCSKARRKMSRFKYASAPGGKGGKPRALARCCCTCSSERSATSTHTTQPGDTQRSSCARKSASSVLPTPPIPPIPTMARVRPWRNALRSTSIIGPRSTKWAVRGSGSPPARGEGTGMGIPEMMF